jgi:hypothetical protein
VDVKIVKIADVELVGNQNGNVGDDLGDKL